MDAFIADVEKAAASGVTGLSVGTTWTQVNLLEAILMADLGSAGYNGLWDGGTDWSGKDVTTALEHFSALMELTNSDRDGLDWTDATQQQIDGTAAYNVMGDWAVASFQQAEWTDGEDFGYYPLAGGDEKIFGFLADSFTLPVGAPNPDGAKAWLDTISSQEGQLAFSLAKGSIPARTDVDTADFPAYQQTAIESYAADTICSSLAHGAATPVAWLNQIFGRHEQVHHRRERCGRLPGGARHDRRVEHLGLITDHPDASAPRHRPRRARVLSPGCAGSKERM